MSVTNPTADLRLRGGRIVTEQGVFAGGIVVREGRIVALVDDTCDWPARRTVDLRGRIVLPGIVDAHVHFNELGHEIEGYAYGTRAAAAGGVTTVIEMPLNDVPAVTNVSILERKREIAAANAVVDYANLGGLVEDNFDELEPLHAAGVVGFKAFMRPVPDFSAVDDGQLYAGLAKSRELGTVICVHAENATLLARLRRQVAASGRVDMGVFAAASPPEVELEAIQRALLWARHTGGRLHVVHVTTSAGIEAIAAARRDGVCATSETCPHYLVLSADDQARLGPVAKVAPPLRSRAEVDALWRAVLRGDVDVIASDHAPLMTAEDIARAAKNPFAGFAGLRGIQTMLPLMIDEGIHRRGLEWPQLVKLMAGNPARRFGLYPKKGAIMPGADADLVIVDPDLEWVVEEETLLSRHRISPYIGMRLRGAVDETILRGETIYQDGRIVAAPGTGELLRPDARN
jgi:allantoinase